MKLPATAALLLLASATLCGQDAETKRKFFSDVHTALALKPGAIVADIGSGDDPMHALGILGVVGETGRVVCVDINQEALDKLRAKVPAQNRNIEFHLGKPDDPLLNRASLDAVLISNAYHEMIDYQAMLTHIRSSLKSGGHLVVIESIDSERQGLERKEQVKHHQLSPELLEAELKAAGFRLLGRVLPLVNSSDAITRYLVSAEPQGQD